MRFAIFPHQARSSFHQCVLLLLGLCIAVLMGCARTSVRPVPFSPDSSTPFPATTRSEPAVPLAKPDRILIYDFAVSADDVTLDRAVGAQLLQRLQGTPQTEAQLKVGRAAAQALSAELVKAIQKLGLPAEQATAAPVLTGNTLAIEGQFVSIDQGNRLRRMVIGLGAGATEVTTQVQVYSVMPAPRRLLQEFETTAQSSRKPGMAETMGVGAAVKGAQAVAIGAGVGVASEHGATVESDASRTAKAIAKELAKFFASKGWIAADTAE